MSKVTPTADRMIESRVRQGEKGGRLVRYTHGHADSVLRSHRWRTAANSAAYLLPSLVPGQRLLDVGAGPGTITADLARMVAPGQVVALEVDERVAAITRSGLIGVPNTEVVVGDVHALEWGDEAFHVVHAHQVLQHVHNPVLALGEMLRVTRPGGVVAIRDSDYGGFVWSPRDPMLDRWLEVYDAAARANGGEPNAGRQLLSWALRAGVERDQVVAMSSTWCFANAEDRAYWGGMWAERILTSALTQQALDTGLSTQTELNAIATAWTRWAADPAGWLSVLHAELLITK